MNGVDSLEDVRLALLESDGHISVVAKGEKQPR